MQVQLPMIHLTPCKCQDVAAERLPPMLQGQSLCQVPNLCVREVEGCEGRFSHQSHKLSPKSRSPGTAKLIGKPVFVFSRRFKCLLVDSMGWIGLQLSIF